MQPPQIDVYNRLQIGWNVNTFFVQCVKKVSMLIRAKSWTFRRQARLSYIMKILPKEERIKTSVYETGADKATAYRRAEAYLAKAQASAKDVAQVKDIEAGRIITKISVHCPQAGESSFAPVSVFATASLDFTAKDNKIRIIFEDISLANRGMDGRWAESWIHSQEVLQTVDSKCEARLFAR